MWQRNSTRTIHAVSCFLFFRHTELSLFRDESRQNNQPISLYYFDRRYNGIELKCTEIQMTHIDSIPRIIGYASRLNRNKKLNDLKRGMKHFGILYSLETDHFSFRNLSYHKKKKSKYKKKVKSLISFTVSPVLLLLLLCVCVFLIGLCFGSIFNIDISRNYSIFM